MSDPTPNREPDPGPIPQNPYAPAPPEATHPEPPRQDQPAQEGEPAPQQRPDYSYPGGWRQTPDGRPWPPPATPPPGTPGMGPPKASGLTITALVLGVAAVCLSLLPFVHFAAFPVGLAAVIVAGIAMARKLHSRALAIAGLTTGIASLVIALLWTLAFAAAFSAFESIDDEFGALDDRGGPAAVETYTFEAWADVPAEVEIYSGLDGEGFRTEEIEAGETFSEDLDADTHAGSISISHEGSEQGVLSCRILDADGRVVSEDSTDAQNLWAICWPDDVEYEEMYEDDTLGA